MYRSWYIQQNNVKAHTASKCDKSRFFHGRKSKHIWYHFKENIPIKKYLNIFIVKNDICSIRKAPKLNIFIQKISNANFALLSSLIKNRQKLNSLYDDR